MDVTIAIATFGDRSWQKLAEERAAQSAFGQGAAVLRHHGGDTIAEARNAALERVGTEWVIFLDGDDELEPGYVEAMARGTTDLRAPVMRAVRGRRTRAPWRPQVYGHTHDCSGACLPQGNWICIGACVRTGLVRAVGGFEEWPIYEDWALWLRLHVAGATCELVEDAVYRHYVREDSRNRSGEAYQNASQWHGRIQAAVLPS